MFGVRPEKKLLKYSFSFLGKEKKSDGSKPGAELQSFSLFLFVEKNCWNDRQMSLNNKALTSVLELFDLLSGTEDERGGGQEGGSNFTHFKKEVIP